MANSITTENVSHRLTEALKFLSGISLDGTYSSSVQNLQSRNVVNKDFLSDGAEKLGILWECDAVEDGGEDQRVLKENKYGGEYHSLSSDSDNVSTLHPLKTSADEPILTKRMVAHSARSKKRSRISNGDSTTKNQMLTNYRKKKLQHSSTCSDSERYYGSSSESLSTNTTGKLKTKGTTCDTITELTSDSNTNSLKSLNGDRFVMVTKKKEVPFLVCSFIPYSANEKTRLDFKKDLLKKRHARARPLSTSSETYNQFELFGIINSEDGQEVSYSKLLAPTPSMKEYLEKEINSASATDNSNPTMQQYNRHLLVRTKLLNGKPGYKWCYSYEQGSQRTSHLPISPSIPMSQKFLYNPKLLDDPELIAGKHRTLLTFSSYVTSVIDYVRPCELKTEINNKFKEKFPHIKLTLSKLRSIKKEMCKIARNENGMDLLTIAQAYVYFEKLILRGLINKHNRKLCAAASLLLSAKLNDCKGDALKVLIERMENVFRLNRKDLFESEFAVLVALEFGLHIPVSEVFPHFQRLLFQS